MTPALYRPLDVVIVVAASLALTTAIYLRLPRDMTYVRGAFVVGVVLTAAEVLGRWVFAVTVGTDSWLDMPFHAAVPIALLLASTLAYLRIKLK